MAVFAQGTPCWVDAQLPDLEGGKRFYGELFGWSFDASRDEALLNGRRVAGLVPKRDGRMPTTWTVYLAADDAGALAARVKAAGGRMVMEPYPVGPFGVLALAADPGGAVFGLRQAGDADGFEVTGEPGSFCWLEVYTRQPEAVDTFYASVFGWLGRQVDPAAEGRAEGFDYRVWSPPGSRPGDDTAFGGRAVITDAFPAEMPGHVLVYFAVHDCDEACATAVRLGGRVAEGPVDTPYGRIAVLHDNQGARFAVLAEPIAEPIAEPTAESIAEPAAEPDPADREESDATRGDTPATPASDTPPK
ncbi:VOC family protein [Streptomyces sp. SKN60]|uniref:VOC family protein n=1 Tax=Streptomyces sp. SKN60 TaxID=2855506 RepID=UPI0022480F42|nr:VOC family protein [Streptomyces sp. SKN60]MCX2183298.1 VOC family protein [Streptomyces sp. SKN60]